MFKVLKRYCFILTTIISSLNLCLYATYFIGECINSYVKITGFIYLGFLVCSGLLSFFAILYKKDRLLLASTIFFSCFLIFTFVLPYINQYEAIIKGKYAIPIPLTNEDYLMFIFMISSGIIFLGAFIVFLFAQSFKNHVLRIIVFIMITLAILLLIPSYVAQWCAYAMLKSYWYNFFYHPYIWCTYLYILVAMNYLI